jgi:hypothetical protein
MSATIRSLPTDATAKGQCSWPVSDPITPNTLPVDVPVRENSVMRLFFVSETHTVLVVELKVRSRSQLKPLRSFAPQPRLPQEAR